MRRHGAAQLLGIHDGDGLGVIAGHIMADADGGKFDAGAGLDLSNSGIIGNYANYPSSGIPTYSDFHLKTALEPYQFFETPGLMAYMFEFKNEPGKKRIGYIAQDVRKKYPDAISYGPQGYLMVDYDQLPGWEELDRLSQEFHGENS